MGQRGQYLLAVGLGCYKWYQSQTPSSVPSEDVGLPRGWIVRSHIGRREERSTPYKGVETYPYQTRFKLMAIRNGPKWTVSVSGGLGLLEAKELHQSSGKSHKCRRKHPYSKHTRSPNKILLKTLGNGAESKKYDQNLNI